MGEEPKDWASIWSNVLQWGILLGAIGLGCVALFMANHFLGRTIFKLLMFGVPVALAAAVAIGSKK